MTAADNPAAEPVSGPRCAAPAGAHLQPPPTPHPTQPPPDPPPPDPPSPDAPAGESSPQLDPRHLTDAVAAAWGVLWHQHRTRDPGCGHHRRCDGTHINPTPAALQTFLTWSDPRRLPSEPMRRVLDADGDFRAQIAAAVTEADCGGIGWLWLTRPHDWRQQAAQLAEQAETRQGARRQQRRIEQTLKEAHQQAERAERRADKAAAKHCSAAKTLERLQRETAESERRVLLAEQALQAAQQRLQTANTQTETLRRRAGLQAAVAETAATNRQEAFDELAAAVEHLEVVTERHQPVRPEPTAPASGSGSGGRRKRRGAEPAPEPQQRTPAVLPAHVTTEAATTEFLLTVPGARILIDGYNLAWKLWPDTCGDDLGDTRSRLERRLHNLAARRHLDVCIVWDGVQEPALALPPHRRGPKRGAADVRFSRPGRSADDSIVAECDSLPNSRCVVVVTEDKLLKLRVRRRGADTLHPLLLAALLPEPHQR